MSDRKKVLLTGANGQLAADLISALSDHELVLVDIDSLDITDREAVAHGRDNSFTVGDSQLRCVHRC
jgi:dTDP-4-dehydrorhamnose reductase